ncbi:hypothetical protein BZG35_16405 [Brevundimonas sp. LM2]|uniref:nuclear transport factor 2 family protein n=1 Tax=Brevundimonas sp. LM2 TaxID=1938605 RepID=UPI00098400DD|nr:nuclear transport factor 2 family protein [Brevundimonas sp. LM2]AQR63063.1 hypothetical protein BZG35_16405 [Brevundimonas sp. LM2]
MTIQHLCTDYLAALNAGDLEAVLRLFSDDAVVVSPLYETRPAATFFQGLFADTSASNTTLLNVFDRSADSGAIALHFRYVWTLSSGTIVEFECVDIFELSASQDRFTKLTIIYDTAPLRADFEASRQAR